MRTLKDVLPANSNNILYVFYYLETTQIKRYYYTAKEHLPNLVCVRDMRKFKSLVSIVNDAAGESTCFG